MRRYGLAVLMVALFFAGSTGRAYAVDDQNCSDFSSQAAAQQHLREDPTDPDHLDADGNGIACETNAGPFDTVPVGSTGATAVRATTTTAATTVQRSTTTTTAVAASDLVNSGPPVYVWVVAVLGAFALVMGSSMRGRRANGTHWH